jgi:hypothetical protein
MDIQERLVRFYQILLDGDTGAFLTMFAGDPLIDTPLWGEVSGEEAAGLFVGGEQQWLNGYMAEPLLGPATVSNERMVVEYVLYLHVQEEMIDLPVALVADLEGGKVSAIRIYHSTWPLTGRHRVRSPLCSPAEDLDEPEIVRQYMDALRNADKEKILALFEEDGYVREPSGAWYTHDGARGREEFYEMAVGTGSVSLLHCTATFDGVRCAIEYICDAWGNRPIPPQAGIAVYELGETGKLFAVRIYDDVSSPEER